MNKAMSFLTRVFNGEDVVMVQRPKQAWEDQFVKGKWDRLASGQKNTEFLAKLVLEQHKNTTPLRVLDVGCGNGGLARLIAGEPGIKYVGIDISETAVVAAREIAPQGQFIVADAEHPSPNVGMFDALVFNEVFFYIDPTCTLPQYRTHAMANAKIYISILHSWRTPFLFHRLRRHLYLDARLRVADQSFRWDIVVGHFI